jgi:hypothetical protein
MRYLRFTRNANSLNRDLGQRYLLTKSLHHGYKEIATKVRLLRTRRKTWLFLLYRCEMGEEQKTIAVIDGQGGGIGSAIIKRLREVLGEELEVIGLGTNAMATGAMLKSGANKGASGENAIVQTVRKVDLIAGTFSIVLANSMMGELTPKMAEAIASSPAIKCLLPLKIIEVEIIGTAKEPLPHLVDHLIKRIAEIIRI